jgi:serine/threonine protein kinase
MSDELRGTFGQIRKEGDYAIKSVYDFFLVPSGQQPADAFEADRRKDMELAHAFILPTLGVVRHDALQEHKPGKVYSPGMEITMPYCQLLYDSSLQERLPKRIDGTPKDAPQLRTLFHLYDSQKHTLGWLAFVGETVLNLATAVQYLHERGVVHLDITPQNVLVNTTGTLDDNVNALFDIARTYLADRAGENIYWYCMTVDDSAVPVDLSVTGQSIQRTKATKTLITGKDPRSLDHKKRVEEDIRLMGCLAAYLLVGEDEELEDKRAANILSPEAYHGLNPTLTTEASAVVEAIRRTGFVQRRNIRIPNFHEHPYSSMQEFIDTFSAALSKHFYVAKRADLPDVVQQNLGSGRVGYIVRTPEQFMRLVYLDRALTTSELIQDMLKFAQHLYGNSDWTSIVIGSGNPALTLPTQRLGGVTETIDAELVERIKAQQKNFIAQKDRVAMQSFSEAEKDLQAAQARRDAALRVHGELEELSKLLE